MDLKIQHFVIFATLTFFSSCSKVPITISKIKGSQIAIDSSLEDVMKIQNFIGPYRDRIDQVLDSALAYAPRTYSKTDGQYNSTLGNLMADIVMKQVNPVFKSRTGKDIDFVLLNFGGIRAPISLGVVSARTAYDVMPFENTIVVVELSGYAVMALVNYLIKAGRAHPISKEVQLILKTDGSLSQISIKGKQLDKNKNYYVATSNYLVAGGDNMDFFKNGLQLTETDYLIRNAMIDYFKKIDTLRAEIDRRFYKLE